MGEGAMEWASSGDLLAFDVSRAFTGALLVLSAVGIATALYKSGIPRAGFVLWLSYVVFVLLNFVLPGIAGEVPGLDARYLYPPLVITAVYFAQPMAAGHLTTLSKAVLCAFIYGTLLAAVLIPDHVVAADYSGLIPGLNFRLYGVGGGATTLGALSAAYLAIEAVSPTRSTTRVFHLLAALCTLILAQSKTSWLFVLLGILYGLYRHLERRLFGTAIARGPRARMARNAFLAVVVCAGVALELQLSDRVDVTTLRGGGNIETLTGRVSIWEASIRVWMDSPVFGYGLGMWVDEAFRAKHGHFAHSHNQFIHALGSAGIVGLIGLLIYLGAGGIVAVRAAKNNPIPLVLMVFVLIQGLTDVPLRNYFVLDSFFLLHLMFFAFLIQEARAVRMGGGRPPGRVGRGTRSFTATSGA